MSGLGVPLINGVRHSWATMRCVILGRVITGITAINWKTKKVKENNYGAGDQPDHRGHGNKEPEAGLTLYKYEVDAIKGILQPGQDLTDVPPFDIPVTWTDANGNTKKVILKDFEFTEEGTDMKQGDTKIEVPCSAIVSAIIYS